MVRDSYADKQRRTIERVPNARLTCPTGQTTIVGEGWRESDGGIAGDGESGENTCDVRVAPRSAEGTGGPKLLDRLREAMQPSHRANTLPLGQAVLLPIRITR